MSSTTTRLQIRTNSRLKREASRTLDRMGIPLSTAINMFLTQVVNQQSLPFQPTVQGIPVEQPQDEYRPLTKEEENALIMEILTGGKSTDENPTD